MVVVCESCSTRFRIDDARIPAKGRLVRCSQCKATFIAKPEDATVDDTIQEVVAEVTDSGRAPAPETTADLFDTVGEDLGETATRPGTSKDEERWEFDEEPRKVAGTGGGADAFGPTSADEDGSRSSLDEIGDPAEWDLLRGSVEPVARQAQFVEPPAPAAARAPAVEAAPEPFLRPLAQEPAPPRRTRGREVGRSLGQLARLTLTGAAWLALATLVLTGAAPLLSEPRQLSVAKPAPRTLGLADGEARGVEGRFVENAFATSLYVIQGELARPNPDRRLGLRAHFTDGSGARIGAGSWAGAERSPRELREWTPGALHDAIEASAPTAALGGRFVAVFDEIPAEAQGFALDLEPLPALPAPVAEAAADATASSPPGPRPSSE